jgi:hypothetical protein
VAVYRGLEKWILMSIAAENLAAAQPQNIHWVIFHAYAASKVHSVQVAQEILLEALSKFPGEAVILDNLACYKYRSALRDEAS